MLMRSLKPVFRLATLFARREATKRIRHRDWLKLAGEKIRCEQVGTVPTFCLFARTKSPSGKRASVSGAPLIFNVLWCRIRSNSVIFCQNF